uniref:Exosome complex exonuclease RRP40 n=1 Tax=Nosema pernyi TaxID=1112939 RepID=A0A0N7ABR4_9MICR|nr:exosome complex exonuclease RRP40 [Nosema pernyi]
MKFTKIREVFPGDPINENLSKSLGIHKDKAIVHGSLCRVQNHLFILSKTKRYFPFIDDLVIGKVIYVNQDYYKVDLNFCIGLLPSLSFTNASKRNKPEIKKDDFLFCKIIKTGIEPLLSCVGEGYGKIEGDVFPLEPWKCQLLYIKGINLKIKCKMVVGLNGFVMIEGETPLVVREVIEKIKEMG